jgi:hypothetical protein
VATGTTIPVTVPIKFGIPVTVAMNVIANPAFDPQQTYIFTVTANNIIGSSQPSLPSNPLVIGYAPGAPTGLNSPDPGVSTLNADASVIHAGVRVIWRMINGIGSGPVNSYTVTANPGSGAVIVPSLDCVNCETVVNGLIPGNPYTFTVSATNAFGTGPNSVPSVSITPGQ